MMSIVDFVFLLSYSDAIECRFLIKDSGSERSVVISSCSAGDALMDTGTLLAPEQISASPLSNQVMESISVLVNFSTSYTYFASSGSRLSTILFWLLFIIARPYFPSSKPKKSDKSCVADTAMPPNPRIVLNMVRQNSAARRFDVAPTSCQISLVNYTIKCNTMKKIGTHNKPVL